MAKSRTAANKASARSPLTPRAAGRISRVFGNGRTPSPQPVYIRLTPLLTPNGGKFKLQLFRDKHGQKEMTDDKPLELLGNGKGEIQFNFIPPAQGGDAVTADLVIIGQTVRDERARLGHRKDTPFTHPSPFSILDEVYYPTYYLPQPKIATGIVLGGKLGVKRVKGSKPSGPYKYTIVALCDGATKVTELDPCVIINPR